ncbi:outer membrane beta-barrel protein [Sphingomonas sp. HF-S3]|jgi:outer membrane immunogenic protein|uniref:Outer membrane beta-barrel protein n=1 Tax=Sphingomonas rustica TaxID=3103142 RepID=A0ABV0B7S7_9SPHN
MRIALITAALAASTALAAPAFAQDSAPFTGPRAEGVVGWDRIDDGANSGTEASDGVVYGGAIGYDFQAGGAVIGVEGEITGSSNKQRARGIIAPNDELSVGAGRDLYLGARVGFLAGPNALIYAKGGYTNARLESRYTNGNTTTTVGENADGWRLGAGVEYQLSNNMYLKGEYRYSNYSRLDNSNIDIDIDRHQVVGGVGIRF